MNGAWNMKGKKLYVPKRITGYVMIVYESQNRFNQEQARSVVQGLAEAAASLEMGQIDQSPPIFWQNGQGDIGKVTACLLLVFGVAYRVALANPRGCCGTQKDEEHQP